MGLTTGKEGLHLRHIRCFDQDVPLGSVPSFGVLVDAGGFEFEILCDAGDVVWAGGVVGDVDAGGGH